MNLKNDAYIAYTTKLRLTVNIVIVLELGLGFRPCFFKYNLPPQGTIFLSL